MEKKELDELYPVLFREVTKAISELESLQIDAPEAKKILEMLKEAQKTTEEMFINGADEDQE